MDIKQLIYLCNLERERHFGRAAEASFVSQPTLSMRLKNLEKELGLNLINRGNNFEGFTAEGLRVLSWAREIVAVYEGLKLEVESLKQGMSGTLRIGVMPQCSVSLAQLIKAVSLVHPGLDYRVSEVSADQLIEALYRGLADNTVGKLIERFLRHDFIVIDDLGFTALDRVAADHLFRFIAAAYEQRSVAITTNVEFERWTQFLPDAATATAILDRFLHHCHVIALDGESFRLREARELVTPA